MIPGAMGRKIHGKAKMEAPKSWRFGSDDFLCSKGVIFRFYVNFFGVFTGGGWNDGGNVDQRLMLVCKTCDFICVYNFTVVLVDEGEGFVRDLEREGVGDVCSSVVVDE